MNSFLLYFESCFSMHRKTQNSWITPGIRISCKKIKSLHILSRKLSCPFITKYYNSCCIISRKVFDPTTGGNPLRTKDLYNTPPATVSPTPSKEFFLHSNTEMYLPSWHYLVTTSLWILYIWNMSNQYPSPWTSAYVASYIILYNVTYRKLPNLTGVHVTSYGEQDSVINNRHWIYCIVIL